MSGADRPPLICWDSCVFLAWFNKEHDKPLSQIEHLLVQIAEGKVNLLVSALSYAEVLDKAGKSDAGARFRDFVQRPNVVVANIDPRIGLMAAEIREAALIAHANGRLSQGIKIPDALIAATAVIYRAGELHTFDPVLLELSASSIVRQLPITSPGNTTRTKTGS